METRIAKITDVKKDAEALRRAGEILRGGGLVAFPTETVYGLGGNGFDGDAAKKIYEAKGRPSDNPLILHVAGRDMIDAAAVMNPMAESILAAFAPGPVTVVLPKRESVPPGVTGGLSTVGIRMPDNDIARAMIRAAGVPVAAPSANISGRPSPTSAEAVIADIGGKIPLILDGGPCKYGVESTIVDCTGDRAAILRPGAVTAEMLSQVLGPLAPPPIQNENDAPKAPGMKYTHYAPKVPLFLFAPSGEKTDGERLFSAISKALESAKAKGKRPGIIACRETSERLLRMKLVLPNLAVTYGKSGDLSAMAAKLYESLRYFDDKDADLIFGEGAPETGLGVAIMNRFKKAAGGRIFRA